MPFITPDTLPETRQCWRVFVPTGWGAFLWGQLNELAKDHNWENVGDVTPEEAALAWATANFETFAMSPCGEGGGMIVGEIKWLAHDTVPDNCLICDGALFSATTYPELASAIGYTFSPSNDEYRLPALYARSIVGPSAGTYVIGDAYGAETKTLDLSEMPPHEHEINNQAASGVSSRVLPSAPTQGAKTATTSVGGGEAFSLYHPVLTLLPVIVASSQ